jgi:hypothetical protein
MDVRIHRVRNPRSGAARLVAAAAALSLVSLGVHGADTDADARARLARENEQLRRQIDLGSETAHLVLDLAGQRLRLMSGGAVLRDYPILAAELGMPTRLFFSTTRASGDWREPIRTGAALEPHKQIGRVEMLPSANPDEPAQVPVPAEPEEALPAPERYVLRYDDGFTIEIRTATAPERPRGFWASFASSIRGRISDAVEIAGGASAPRLRLVLSAKDAGALYRSFPLDSKLVVI